jgi:hypothetical protein
MRKSRQQCLSNETLERTMATLQDVELGSHSGDTLPGVAEYLAGITLLGAVFGTMLAAVGAIWGLAIIGGAYPAVAFTAAGGLLLGGFSGLVAASATTRTLRRGLALGAAAVFGSLVVFVGVVGLRVWMMRLV